MRDEENVMKAHYANAVDGFKDSDVMYDARCVKANDAMGSARAALKPAEDKP